MQKTVKWWSKPTSLEEFEANIDYIMFVDENGHATHLDKIKRKLAKGETVKNSELFFTVTGCAIARTDFPQIRQKIIELKARYWPPNGEYLCEGSFRKVCFHSRDIRRRNMPFTSKQIDRNRFLQDLSNFISNSPFVVFSSTLNTELHAMRYKYPQHPYNLCINFIFERFAKYFLLPKQACGAVVFEARGKKEDFFLLNHCVQILKNGTCFALPKELKTIKGIYFNPKWSQQSNFKKSYFGLEIADLVSYPIHKFARDNIKDPAYKIIEPKFYGYPNYIGKGLKIFP